MSSIIPQLTSLPIEILTYMAGENLDIQDYTALRTACKYLRSLPVGEYLKCNPEYIKKSLAYAFAPADWKIAAGRLKDRVKTLDLNSWYDPLIFFNHLYSFKNLKKIVIPQTRFTTDREIEIIGTIKGIEKLIIGSRSPDLNLQPILNQMTNLRELTIKAVTKKSRSYEVLCPNLTKLKTTSSVFYRFEDLAQLTSLKTLVITTFETNDINSVSVNKIFTVFQNLKEMKIKSQSSLEWNFKKGRAHPALEVLQIDYCKLRSRLIKYIAKFALLSPNLKIELGIEIVAFDQRFLEDSKRAIDTLAAIESLKAVRLFVSEVFSRKKSKKNLEVLQYFFEKLSPKIKGIAGPLSKKILSFIHTSSQEPSPFLVLEAVRFIKKVLGRPIKFGNLLRLRKISFYDCKIQAELLKNLADNLPPNLRSFVFITSTKNTNYPSHQTGEEFKPILEKARLKMLALYYPQVNDKTVSLIAQYQPKLAYLHLIGENITLDSVEDLSKLTHLKGLMVGSHLDLPPFLKKAKKNADKMNKFYRDRLGYNL